MRNTCRLWTETTAVLWLAACAHSKQRSPVEGIVESQDLVFFLVKIIHCITSRQFQCSLIHFGSGICQKNTFGKGCSTKRIGQIQGRLIGQDITDMPEFASLFHQGIDQFRVCMSERRDRNAPGKVDIFITLVIPQSRAPTIGRHDFHGRIVRRHHRIEGIAYR